MRYGIGLLGPSFLENQSCFFVFFYSTSFVRRVVGKDHASEYMDKTVLPESIT